MAETTLTDGSPVTSDHREINPETGQQKGYVVLSEDERSKGFVRPVRRTYKHLKCGSTTTMGQSLTISLVGAMILTIRGLSPKHTVILGIPVRVAGVS